MKKLKEIEKEYINLLSASLKSKDDTINELLRINRDLINETRNLIYEFRKSIEKRNDNES